LSRTYRFGGRPIGGERVNPHHKPEGHARNLRRGREHARAGEEFRCRHCKRMVGLPLWGGGHRNHCPFCLHSRHVDGKTPGDRTSECGASMAPVGAFARSGGEHVIVHRCLGCGFERHNRIAADDHFDLVLALPLVKPRLPK
jgi:hypothetical protein